MAKGYSRELVGVRDGSRVPPDKADGRVYHARSRTIRATFDLALASVAKANGDNNVLGVIPKGHRFAGARVTSSVTLGASTVAIGTAASPELYKAAGTFTTPDTPTTFAKASALAADPLSTDTEIVMTIGAANLPGAGTVVVELFYTGR